MYLDRPLRRHTLFQAITRTNRQFTHPRTGREKRHGEVVDYVGLGNQIAQALKAADPDTGGKRPVEVDGLVAEFQATVTRTLTRVARVNRSDRSLALQEATERLADHQARDAYTRDLAVQSLWEFLDPDEALTFYATATGGWPRCTRPAGPPGCPTRCCGTATAPRSWRWCAGHISAVEASGSPWARLHSDG
jgi:hypothetical protein